MVVGKDLAETNQETVVQASEESSPAALEYVYQPTVSPERTAWFVLLVGFAMFCLLTVTTVLGIYFYLFRSTIAIPAVLQVAQGTVGITGSDFVEAVEREREDLTDTVTSISTDSQSQATIQFRDILAVEDEVTAILAAVTLQPNTFVTLNRAARPRFDWSLNEHFIRLSRLKGQLDVLVVGAAGKPFLMSVGTAQKLTIELKGDGRYRISATDDEVRVNNLDGTSAAYFSDDMAHRSTIKDGQELIVRLGNRSFEIRSTMANVLSNASFSTGSKTDTFDPSVPWQQAWNCAVSQVQLPQGQVSLNEFDGRVGLRLRRLDNATSHGEVNCKQSFAGEGLDVSAFDSIKIIVTFHLNYQSLSQCGILGSECPLMLRLDYDDHLPVGRHWIRGFHYEKEVSTDYFTRCNTCLQDHQIINKRVWYTFESENLLSLIDRNDHPKILRSLQFYASGHQFDTIVSEIILLVGISDNVLPSEEEQN